MKGERPGADHKILSAYPQNGEHYVMSSGARHLSWAVRARFFATLRMTAADDGS